LSTCPGLWRETFFQQFVVEAFGILTDPQHFLTSLFQTLQGFLNVRLSKGYESPQTHVIRNHVAKRREFFKCLQRTEYPGPVPSDHEICHVGQKMVVFFSLHILPFDELKGYVDIQLSPGPLKLFEIKEFKECSLEAGAEGVHCLVRLKIMKGFQTCFPDFIGIVHHVSEGVTAITGGEEGKRGRHWHPIRFFQRDNI